MLKIWKQIYNKLQIHSWLLIHGKLLAKYEVNRYFNIIIVVHTSCLLWSSSHRKYFVTIHNCKYFLTIYTIKIPNWFMYNFRTKWGSRLIVVISDLKLSKKFYNHPELQGRFECLSLEIFQFHNKNTGKFIRNKKCIEESSFQPFHLPLY